MPEVVIHEDENFERALKRFKKKCEKAGILSDLRKYRHYEKPSERKKRKMIAARRKNRSRSSSGMGRGSASRSSGSGGQR
jgi:small subunit ribosomal protein S21